MCEFCFNPEIIFPFELSKVAVCQCEYNFLCANVQLYMKAHICALHVHCMFAWRVRGDTTCGLTVVDAVVHSLDTRV